MSAGAFLSACVFAERPWGLDRIQNNERKPMDAFAGQIMAGSSMGFRFSLD